MTTTAMCPTCGGEPSVSCICLTRATAARMVDLWRANVDIGGIATATGLSSDSVYRHVVLSGEMRRSLRTGLNSGA